MIFYKVQNLMVCNERIMVHGCNDRGVMGSGVARFVRDYMPAAYEAYVRYHQRVGLKLGDVITAMVNRDGYPDVLVVNGVTQSGFGAAPKRYVDYDAVREVIRKTVEISLELDPRGELDIAMPKIGAGLGGGDWRVIEEIIAQETEAAGVDVVVYVMDPAEIPDGASIIYT